MSRRKRQRQLERAKRAQQQAAAANPGPAIAPPAPAVIAADETPERSGGETRAQEQSERIGPEGPRWYLWVQTLVGIGLLTFTAGQMYYGYWQWDATNKQYAAMLEQNQVAREAMEVDAKNARIEVRAHLEAVVSENAPLVSGNTIFFLVKNLGRTPAYEVTVRTVVQVQERFNLRPPPVKLYNRFFDNLTLAPDGSEPIKVECPEGIEEPEDATTVLVVYGLIAFRDVFGDRHLERFRLIHNSDPEDITVRDAQREGER